MNSRPNSNQATVALPYVLMKSTVFFDDYISNSDIFFILVSLYFSCWKNVEIQDGEHFKMWDVISW